MERGKINGVISIPSSLNGSFFRYWLDFLAPFHRMTNREMDLATAFIKQRYILSKSIKDEVLLDKVTMSVETKKKIMEECGIASQHYQVLMGKLKKAHFIVDGKINPKFIPKNINDGDSSFQLLLYFDLNGRED